MRIGINASFLDKRGTGIGQVTESFLITLGASEAVKQHEWFVYTEEEFCDEFLHPFKTRVVRPWWKRNDLLRRYLWERFQLSKAVKRDQLDAFISLYQSPTQLSRNVQHTMVVHDLIPELFPEYQRNTRQHFYWVSTKSGIQSADHIVAVSQSTKEDILRLFPLLKTSITVASPGLPISFERAQIHTEPIVKGEYIYHGGGLEIRKNTETLLEAYQRLRAQRQTEGRAYPKLVVSGKIHSEDNYLAFPIKQYVAEHHLENDVVLTGFVTQAELKTLYRYAKFFVYPSVYEGFGLPILEALSQGTPTLSSDASSLPEVGGEAVVFFRPEDKDGLLQLLDELDTQPEKRASLSVAGPQQAQRFSWEAFSHKLLTTVIGETSL